MRNRNAAVASPFWANLQGPATIPDQSPAAVAARQARAEGGVAWLQNAVLAILKKRNCLTCKEIAAIGELNPASTIVALGDLAKRGQIIHSTGWRPFYWGLPGTEMELHRADLARRTSEGRQRP